MASLTAHLRRPDDHGRLGFHPECPICRRERLAGALPADAIVSRRSEALLAASVLALSSATPTAVLAAEPDHEQEGATAPEQVTADGGPRAPEFDAAGQPTELRFDAGPAPEDNAAQDPSAEAAPIEQEPVTDGEMPADEAGEGTGIESAGQQEEPPAADPSAPPPAVETVAPAATTPANEAPVATHDEPQVDGSAPAQVHTPGAGTDAAPVDRSPKPDTTESSQPRSAAVQPTASTIATPAAAVKVPNRTGSTMTIRVTQTPSATTAIGHAAKRGDRVHVVQRGESLWSIAKDLLGDDASISRIAREVNRLWELNSARIGTGEPDLLLAGTRIVLR